MKCVALHHTIFSWFKLFKIEIVMCLYIFSSMVICVFAVLHMKTRKNQEHAQAASTRKNIIRHISVYLTFCMLYKFAPLRASGYCLAMFATYLAEKIRSVRTIANYISSVILLHKMVGRIRQAAPVTPEILLRMREHLNLSDPIDATFWALFIVCFHILVRASNVTPKTQKAFDGNKQLTRGDIILGRRTALIHIKWSKTVQCGEKLFVMPLVAIEGSKLCPIWALKNMLALSPMNRSAPAFCYPDGQPISYWQFLTKFKSLISLIGLDCKMYSAHSFRRGGCTALFNANVRDSLIKLVGTWTSSCYLNYVTWPLQARLDAAVQYSNHLGSF